MRPLTIQERTEETLKELCLSLTGAIEHMHSHGIKHTHIEDFQGDYKICDFWKEREMSENYEIKKPGDPVVYPIKHDSPSKYARFIAPELRRNHVYDERTDFWNLGFFMYKWLEDQNAVNTRLRFRDAESFKMITRGVSELSSDHWSKFSEDCRDVIKGLLVADPAKRLNAELVRAHLWFMTPEDREKEITRRQEEIEAKVRAARELLHRRRVEKE
jgi:serine/threonine protein kinase